MTPYCRAIFNELNPSGFENLTDLLLPAQSSKGCFAMRMDSD
jgi:hypothetical protein